MMRMMNMRVKGSHDTDADEREENAGAVAQQD